MTQRRRISSGGPWEAVAGYSRAIVVGDCVLGRRDDRRRGRRPVAHPGDIAAQARAALAIIEARPRRGGFGLADVVRTRMFVTDIARSAEVVAVHGEVFGAIRPAATLVEVSALIDPSLLIEIEAEARRG